jgi:hypothetical protein
MSAASQIRVSRSDESRLTPSDHLLNRLQIPSNKKEQFRLSILGLVGSTFRQSEQHLRAGQITRPLARIADLSSRLVRALVAVNEGQDAVAWAVRDRLEYELRHASDRPNSLNYSQNVDLVSLQRELAEFLFSACKRASARASSNHEARGGKPGIRGHSGALSFISQLVTRILRAGGQLNPANEAGGDLIELLEELRHNLPPSFLPERHPISAYNRCVEKATEEYNRLRLLAFDSAEN